MTSPPTGSMCRGCGAFSITRPPLPRTATFNGRRSPRMGSYWLRVPLRSRPGPASQGNCSRRSGTTTTNGQRSSSPNWIAAAIQFGEELRCPFVVVVPDLLEQFPCEAGPGLDLRGTRSQYDPILGERLPLKVAVLGNGGLVMEKAPQPRHIDPVGGEVIHEPQLKFVVVDRRREVTVEDLETVVRRHVERVLDVLNG